MIELNQEEKHDIIHSLKEVLNKGEYSDWSKIDNNSLRKNILTWSIKHNHAHIVSDVLQYDINLHEIDGVVLNALMADDERILEYIISHESRSSGSNRLESFIIGLPPVIESKEDAFSAINHRSNAYVYVNRAIVHNVLDKDDLISLMLLCVDNDNLMMTSDDIMSASRKIKKSLELIFKGDHDVNVENGLNNVFDYICGIKRIGDLIIMAEKINTDGSISTVVNNSWKIMLSCIFAVSINKTMFDTHIRKFRKNIINIDGEIELNQRIRNIYAKSDMSKISIDNNVMTYPDLINDVIKLHF